MASIAATPFPKTSKQLRHFSFAHVSFSSHLLNVSRQNVALECINLGPHNPPNAGNENDEQVFIQSRSFRNRAHTLLGRIGPEEPRWSCYSCTNFSLRSDRFGSIRGFSWARNVMAHMR